MPPRDQRTSSRRPDDGFPPSVLREYALLADGERGAVVSPHGEIVWLCAPSWDSPAVFAALLGGRGGFAVRPVDRHVWGGYYEPGSLIFRNRFITDGGIVECRDVLAFPGDRHRLVLLRRVHALRGSARLHIRFDPAIDDGRHPVSLRRRPDGVLEGQTGPLRIRLSGLSRCRRVTSEAAAGVTVFDLRLEPGEHHDLVLEISDEQLPDELPEPARLWSATEAAWQQAVPPVIGLPGSDGVRHSVAVLRGLTADTGGMVAAATTSLPERADAGRNYDYRYVWIRDQCFAGLAGAAAGLDSLVDPAVRFATARLLEHGDGLSPAYTTAAGRVPDQRRLDLPGYPGGTDLVGNQVNSQFQLDAFGEALSLLAAAAQRGRLDDDGYHAAAAAANAIAARWDEPDAGIWEIEPRHWTQSRLACVAGLSAMARQARTGSDAAGWLALADAMLARTAAEALHPSGRWQRSPDDTGLDGALIIPPLRGALPTDDPRTTATLQAYLHDLTRSGYAYRFRQDERPLGQAEGSFSLCGFHTAMALHQQHRTVEAVGWFERLAAAAGPAQLFSEEFDTTQHQLRGNLPQAFVHAAHLEAAARLADDPAFGSGPSS